MDFFLAGGSTRRQLGLPKPAWAMKGRTTDLHVHAGGGALQWSGTQDEVWEESGGIDHVMCTCVPHSPAGR